MSPNRAAVLSAFAEHRCSAILRTHAAEAVRPALDAAVKGGFRIVEVTLTTPDALRGRMTSVNMIFFMGGPQLGELEAGYVASLFTSSASGVRVSVVSGGLVTLLVVALVAAAAPVVRAYEAGGVE